MARTRRRGWPGLVVGLIVLFALLWLGYWYAARYAAETALARVNAGPVDGARVNCTGATIGGFPLVLDIRCERATYALGDNRITAAVGGVAATAPLYWPGSVAAKLDAPFVVNAPALGVALTTTWTDATGHASAWLSGLRGFGASFVGLDANNDGDRANVLVKSLAAASANASIDPAGGDAYTIRAGAKALKLTLSSGRELPDIDGEARITLLEVGGALGNNPAETLLAWLRRGGTANIERLRIDGVGATITTDGTLRLSPEGLLNGSVVLRWNRIEAVADFVEALMPGTREYASLPLQGLNAMSIPVETVDGPLRQTALSFTDGVVGLGIFPLPIDPIPPLRF